MRDNVFFNDLSIGRQNGDCGVLYLRRALYDGDPNPKYRTHFALVDNGEVTIEADPSGDHYMNGLPHTAHRNDYYEPQRYSFYHDDTDFYLATRDYLGVWSTQDVGDVDIGTNMMSCWMRVMTVYP